jgi:NAD(P)-dependent dehydrogenase (short-subunit alcohol dehydrogenase family)
MRFFHDQACLMGRVQDKVALVTGGAGGIGFEAAKLLVEEGAQVYITDILVDEGEAAAQKIGATFHQADAADERAWQDLAANLKTKHGHIDILFNNAGITGLSSGMGPQSPEHTFLEDWHRVHHINLDSVFLGCKYGTALMKQRGGSIINMSSRSGMVGIPGACAYASSKAAIRNHTKTVALYCAEQGYRIRCNSLHPGAILTPMWDAMLGTDDETRQQGMQAVSAGIPLGRMGTPQEVAYAVLYLGSDESTYITGTELTLDGGILAGATASPQKQGD